MDVFSMIIQFTLGKKPMITFCAAESFWVMVFNMFHYFIFRDVAIAAHRTLGKTRLRCIWLITMFTTDMEVKLAFVVCFKVTLITF